MINIDSLQFPLYVEDMHPEDDILDKEDLRYAISSAKIRMRQEMNAYRHHPDPRDPDWPGHERELKGE